MTQIPDFPNTHSPADIPPPPEPPSDEECCNSGCEELCVFEIYRVQKAEYDAKYNTFPQK